MSQLLKFIHFPSVKNLKKFFNKFFNNFFNKFFLVNHAPVCIVRSPPIAEGASGRREQEEGGLPAVPQGIPRPALPGAAHEGSPLGEQLRVQRLWQVLPGQALAHQTPPECPPTDQGRRGLKLALLSSIN